MSQNLNISAPKQRCRPPRFFAIGLAVVFLLAAAGLCQAAVAPSLPAAAHPAQVTHPTHTLAGTAGGVRHEWVFVDTSVADYRDLVADLAAGGHDGRRIEVVLIDSRRDGVVQMAAALAGYSDIDAIHLITHGSRAELQLGTARLNPDSMSGAYAQALAQIGRALSAGGDILVYGCNFGEGAPGRDAAARLAELTGADIAASDDRTGAEALGGDWDLEVATGRIESAIAVSTQAQSDWGGLLVTPVITARETVDSDADGQIDQIKITTDQNLDDDFSGLTMTVDGYNVIDYSSDIDNDNIFYVNLTESGGADTDATPDVTVTANTTLSEDGGANNIAVAEPQMSIMLSTVDDVTGGGAPGAR